VSLVPILLKIGL
jgi:hypothetical protein